MTTPSDRDKERISKLSWREAFIELYQHILNNHMIDASNFGRVYLVSKDYRIEGESVKGKPQLLEICPHEAKNRFLTLRRVFLLNKDGTYTDSMLLHFLAGYCQFAPKTEEEAKLLLQGGN